MRVAAATPWAETVLHVLAHVDVGRIAASCFSPAWIRYAADRFGPATERLLAEDARLLAQAAGTHDVLAQAHAVIGLFAGEDDVSAARARDLAELGDADVRSPLALRLAREALGAAEILRAAAELELPLVGALPPIDTHAVALDAVLAAAPELARCDVFLARPLGLRGRVLERAVLVGAPGHAGADAEHVAWQAAHEATVAEVVAAGSAKTHDDVERTAIALLRARARAAGLGDAHARWLGRLDLSALGPIPDVPHGTE